MPGKALLKHPKQLFGSWQAGTKCSRTPYLCKKVGVGLTWTRRPEVSSTTVLPRVLPAGQTLLPHQPTSRMWLTSCFDPRRSQRMSRVLRQARVQLLVAMPLQPARSTRRKHCTRLPPVSVAIPSDVAAAATVDAALTALGEDMENRQEVTAIPTALLVEAATIWRNGLAILKHGPRRRV